MCHNRVKRGSIAGIRALQVRRELTQRCLEKIRDAAIQDNRRKRLAQMSASLCAQKTAKGTTPESNEGDALGVEERQGRRDCFLGPFAREEVARKETPDSV